MSCARCGGKGYVEAPLLLNAGNYGIIQQCCDIKKYSAEIERRLNDRLRSYTTDETEARRILGHSDTMAKIIPFTKKR